MEVGSKKIILSACLLITILMMILPVPSWLLDVGIASSFALSILVFSVIVFIDDPLEFTSFPTVLLASLSLRLSLNVSSTKLIIGEGHGGIDSAGSVIESFSMLIMGGNLVLGLIVFCVLLIINFLVITKGATRMAEVGARFALDGMPGRQLAIDSDLAAGAISHEEAKDRRKREQEEAAFFGSLDGASKFVKGDAIAGLLITLLNLGAGLVVGTMIHDLNFFDAFETYSILTVGDGLVNQVPAVIIAIASALILARGGSTGPNTEAVFQQIARYPQALVGVSILMICFSILPGLPFQPFFIGGVFLFSLYYLLKRARQTPLNVANLADPIEEPLQSSNESLGDLLDFDDVHVKFSPELVPMILDTAAGLDVRISQMRRYLISEFGMILSEVRLTDDSSLKAGEYTISIHGVEQARSTLKVGSVLAILHENSEGLPPGDDVREPVFGAPARWIDDVGEDRPDLSRFTLVSSSEVLATHLLEVIKANFSLLLTGRAVHRIIEENQNVSDRARAALNRRVFEDIIPDKVPFELLLRTLRLLIEEHVSIRNLPLILDAIVEARGSLASPEQICDHVRQRLGFQIVARLRRDDGTVPLIQLAAGWEDKFSKYQVQAEHGRVDVALPPEDFNRLAAQMSEQVTLAGEKGTFPAIITTGLRRRFLRTVLMANGIRNPVLSFEELGVESRPSLVGLVPL